MSYQLDRVRSSAAGSLSDRIYEQIYRSISVGDWPVGTRLPTEVELAEQFGVSRPVVREAMLRLRIDGLIESRQGAGTRVISAPNRSVMQFAEPGSVADLQRCYEFRVGVEGESAYLAAERQSRERIAEIEEVLERSWRRQREQPDTSAESDIAFHIAVANATENSYYYNTVTAVSQALHVGTRIAIVLSQASPQERIAQAYAEHRRILDAIIRGDAEGARLAMRTHIEGARRRVFVGS